MEITCKDKYKKFIENGDQKTLQDCYYDKELTITDKENPVKITETCKLISKRADKETYYKHTYDPTRIMEKIKLSKSKYKDQLLEDMRDIFVTDKRENCCNCIAISLYWTSDDLLQLLRKYLYTIQRTIKNVKRCLPDWIVRLYRQFCIPISKDKYIRRTNK